MLRTRVIPCLLMKNNGLVKTINFSNPKYLGDPINTVKIFNEKEVDELILLDINGFHNAEPNFKMISEVASECFMPLCYGGGIKKLEDVKKLFNLGVEKVAINTSAAENPKLIEETAKVFGNQSIVVSIDVKKNFWGKYEVYTHNGKKNTKLDPVQYAVQMESLGAGEIFLNSIDKDGTMKGYDIKLIQKITSAVTIPVIACGGAGNLNHFSEAIKDGGASAVSAGSYFVFQGKHRAVLINFLSNDEINLINNAKL